MIRDRQRLRALHSVHRSLPKSILWSLHNDNSSSTNKNNSTKIWASVQETEFGVYSWCLVLSKGPILSLLKTAIQLSSYHLLKRSFSSMIWYFNNIICYVSICMWIYFWGLYLISLVVCLLMLQYHSVLIMRPYSVF